MSNKQLLALFVCSLVPWTAGNGLVPLLPVYAIQLGADPAIAGYYLAFSYIALAIGALSAGWISDRFDTRKKPLVISGLIGIPIAWLMGRVDNIWGLSLLTFVLWYCGGLGLALISILAGLFAGKDERGKIFGILAVTGGLGAIIGGLATGFLTDKWGYQVMFSVLSIYLVLWPLVTFFLKDVHTPKTSQSGDATRQKEKFNRSYHLLISASLIASIASFIIVLGRSILMGEAGFNAFAISSTGAISGFIALPIPFVFGWLSDRTGRKLYLYIGYLAGIISLLILNFSNFYWQFILVMVLQSLFMNVSTTVANALVTDQVPARLLGRGLSLLGATGWIGGVVGFGIAGFTLQYLGKSLTLTTGIALTLIAMILLIPIRSAIDTQKSNLLNKIS